MQTETAADDILSIRKLTVEFRTDEGRTRALTNFGYSVKKGTILAVVGESGCGKTVHSLAIMGLLPAGSTRIVSGEIFYGGQDLLKLPRAEVSRLRGAKIAMIFQDPMTSLNPVMTIGDQLCEAITVHEDVTRAQAEERSCALLEKVGIRDSRKKLSQYPHQFSGGMRQRVMIAMALTCNPDILIADEPTTALDVTIQAQILDLIKNLQRERGMTAIIITHNLGIVADIADEVAVVYAGRCLERAATEEIFAHPLHPYTKGLLASIPPIHIKRETLHTIAGHPPAAGKPVPGCAFAERCPQAWDLCIEDEPEEFEAAPNHTCRCWLCKKEPA